tara:strand:+ start:697 stop:924 length:228 start_codon:yes stop_codon:yes gene_type:complete
MTKLFEIADLVKWYDYYDDEIVRDAGLGVVLDAKHHGRATDYEYTSYMVYKFKTGSKQSFPSFDLEEIIPPVPKR